MSQLPIGISFLPSVDNQIEGPRRGQLEGDLGQAFKILSLRLPRRPSIRGVAPPELMNAQGSDAFRGFNPHAAAFEAMLKASAMGGGRRMFPGMPTIGPGRASTSVMPGITEGDQDTGAPLPSFEPPPPSAPAPTSSPFTPPIGMPNRRRQQMF